MKRRLGVGVLAACMVAATATSAADLAAHRAVYAMSLASTKMTSGITAASGDMVYKFADSCDGWTVENRTNLNFSYAEGGEVATTWDFVTWESKDGQRYRFRVRSTRDGTVTEEIDGTARIDPRTGAGVVKFTQPEPMNMKLPKGTLFPTEHTNRLIDAAQAGGKVFHRVIFDGSGTDGPFDVNAVIGRERTADAPGQGPQSPLTRTPSWGVMMAFFPVEAKDATPDYEVHLRYHTNGVAQEVLQQFGNFSLRGKLMEVEMLPKPSC